MKILHIVPTYLPAYGYGGPILSVHALNKWLVKIGIDVTVYTTNMDGKKRLNIPPGEERNVDGVKVIYFPVTFSPWQYSSAMRIALESNIGNFDLVHITSVFLAASALGAHYAKKFHKPYIISPRGSLMKEPLARKNFFKKKIYLNLIEKKNLAGASAIHFTAESEKKEYMEAELPFKNSFIISNGLDMELLNKDIPPGIFRNKYAINSDRKIFLSLGRLSWKKGFDTLIPAFRRVVDRKPEALLVIAGGDAEGYQKTIERLISENGLKLGENIIFTGELLGDMKITAFRESDAFVLPSYSENFGMAAAESMKLGTPVFVSSTTAIAHYLDSNSGIVINMSNNESDIDKWADKMLWLVDHAYEAKKMVENAKKIAEEEFSMDKVSNMMLSEYNKIIKK